MKAVPPDIVKVSNPKFTQPRIGTARGLTYDTAWRAVIVSLFLLEDVIGFDWLFERGKGWRATGHFEY